MAHSIFSKTICWTLPCSLLVTISLWAQDAPSTPLHSLDEQLSHRWQTEIQPLLAKFCFECHAAELAEAEVDLSQYANLESVRKQPALWDQVRGVVRIGAMPPVDSPQLEPKQRQLISQWAQEAIHRTDCTQPHPPGPITLRRLNNSEYDNTIRDLLSIDLSVSKKIAFVSDEVGNGFDNQGEVLSLPPLVMEKYVQAAEYISNEAVVADPEKWRKQTGDGGYLDLHESLAENYLTAQGDYQVSLRTRYGKSERGDSIVASVLIDHVEVKTLTVPMMSKTFEFRHAFEAGSHEIRIVFSQDPNATPIGTSKNRLQIEKITLDGPHEGVPALPASHERVIGKTPHSSLPWRQAAEFNVSSLLRRAYRRNPDREDIDRIVAIVERAIEQGFSFEESIRFGLQAILVSSEFLFRMEGRDTSGLCVRPGVRRVGNFELASRLSYFLWSSMPDDELLDDADQGKLQETEVLVAHVKRMMEDPKSIALVQRFFGQWLGLFNLNAIDIDDSAFPMWCDRLRLSMQRETELLCQEVIRRDGSVQDLLTADYTFVNPRLAELYGVPFDGQDPELLYRRGPGLPRDRDDAKRTGVYLDENRWIRIQSPAGRQGLLTHASILALTSNPNRTSPVKRGKWVLESLLGEPPPPAPPNVPSLEESAREHKNLSLQQQLEIHRSNPSCASCHRVMDPLGLGLENYDAIGKYRVTDGSHKIISQGELSDGRKFSNAKELVMILANENEKLSRHFLSNLFTFALGRGLTSADQCTVDDMIEKASREGNSILRYIELIVLSDPFRLRSETRTDPINAPNATTP